MEQILVDMSIISGGSYFSWVHVLLHLFRYSLKMFPFFQLHQARCYLS